MKIFSAKENSRPSSILMDEERETTRIIRLQGPIDMTTVAELELFQKKWVDQKGFQYKHVLLDFEKVTHTDSATVAALIVATSALKKEHHKLGVINLGEKLRSMFEIFKANKLVFSFPSESEAIKKLI